MKTCLLWILISLGAVFSQENYAGWAYWRTITVNTSSTGAGVLATQTNFPLLIRLNAANFNFAHAKGNGADIRFTKPNGTTRLKHQIERWDSAGKTAEVWVLADTVRGNTLTATSIRLYSGRASAADSSNGKAVFDTANGYQGVFHLAEATNDTARDATANGFKGIPRNKGGVNPTDTVGAIGHAKNFLGSNLNNNGGSYQILTSTGGNTYTNNALNFQNDSNNFNGLPQYTISTWINVSAFPTGTNNLKGIVAKSNGPLAMRQYHLLLIEPRPDAITSTNDSNRINFSDGPTATYQNWKSNFTPNTWFHLSVVRSGPAGPPSSLRICLNVRCFEGSTSTTATIQQNLNVYIGSFSNDSGYFNGKLDEVRFENRARDSMWLKLAYETQKPGATCVSVSQIGDPPPGAPISVAYQTNPLILTAGAAMTPDVPSVLPSGVTGLTHTVTPALPSGLTLSTQTGLISGTPTAGITVPQTNYTVSATNVSGSASVVVAITVFVGDPYPPEPPRLTYLITSMVLTAGVAMTSNTPVVFAPSPVTITVNPALPSGLALHQTTGVISGTPVVGVAVAQTNYSVTATNLGGSVSRVLSLTVNLPTGISSKASESFVLRISGMSPISFQIPDGVASARLSIADLRDRTVWTQTSGSGVRELTWNGITNSGRPASAGIYVARMTLLDTKGKTTSMIEKRITYGP